MYQKTNIVLTSAKMFRDVNSIHIRSERIGPDFVVLFQGGQYEYERSHHQCHFGQRNQAYGSRRIY